MRTELAGHLNERVAEFRLGGLSVEEAEQRTLRELGAPERVSGGMLGVHTLPALGKAGALSVLLATALLTALPQGLAQVKGIYGSIPNIGQASYLNFEQLKAAIEKAGGELSGKPDDAFLTVPGAPRSHYPLNTMKWPRAALVQESTSSEMLRFIVSCKKVRRERHSADSFLEITPRGAPRSGT
ncbi:permease prefix domain 1-containing protein, partial [Deinococcus alpinitundrae]|uniref:permease prefix domain 1-containing protein n=1 Tax=Deinococcus alpinitundrae TaxID=468913 RepID=UPI001ED954DE